MNKLLEAGQKVRERIYNLADSEGRLNFCDLDMIEETVREVCAEYARIKINKMKLPIPCVTCEQMENPLFPNCYNCQRNDAMNFLNTHYLDLIDQDLLSLKEKNI